MKYPVDQHIYKRMKIIVTTQQSGEHKVEVVENGTTFHTELVSSIEQRDKIIWDLADLYNAIDIEIVTKTIKPKEVKKEFMYSEIPTIPVLYDEEAQDYFDEESEFVFERIVQAIDEGLQAGVDNIRLFELDGTGKYLTSKKEDWKEGLEQAIQYFITVERYEQCKEAQDLIDKLN